ncbi:MAG: hypothetical protein GX638_18765 [Crenarchaeota archaeon]|nr:hypothetical protein [Thermoproteota archaeon]
MSITAEIPPGEIDKLKTVLDRISGELKKSSVDILRQAMIFAIQSAAKHTKPGLETPSKLQDKYKYRPIVDYHSKVPLYINDSSGYVFSTKEKVKSKNVRRITRAFRYWDKKNGKKGFLPYYGTGKKKYDKETRMGKIPYAGAAKAGWLKALNRLPQAPGYSDAGAETGTAMPIVIESRSESQHGISVENVIRYIGKTSPNAANIGLSSATNRMIGAYKKKIADLEKYKA